MEILNVTREAYERLKEKLHEINENYPFYLDLDTNTHMESWSSAAQDSNVHTGFLGRFESAAQPLGSKCQARIQYHRHRPQTLIFMRAGRREY
jgi:hypothetical protein